MASECYLVLALHFQDFLLLLYIHSIVSSSDLARIAFLTPYFLVDSNKKKELCFDWSQNLDVRTLSGPYSEMGQYAWTSRFESLASCGSCADAITECVADS